VQKSVLVFTRKKDGHADRLRTELEKLGATCVRVNIEEIGQFSFEFSGDQLIFYHAGTSWNVAELSSVFIRALPASEDFGVKESMGDVTVESYIAIQREGLFHDWLAAVTRMIPVFNDFQSAVRCMGKGFQRRVAKEVGLSTTEQYIGASTVIAEKFCRDAWSSSGEVCTKPVAHKTVLIDGTRTGRFTEKLQPERVLELADLQDCPLIFERYVDKSYELRVTVVEDKVLACKICSQEAGGDTSIDWRHYNIARTPHYAYDLPESIANKLIAFHRATGLRFSAFDLIRTTSGEYIFLETNPSGQWQWLEDLVGLPITASLAASLHSPKLL
jgi:hypothetical protein